MKRRRLAVLDERHEELENCAFCPKLCRAACPVSDAEPTETLTPWGKMGTVFAVARSVAEISEAYAAPAWGCTGCFACRERCEQRNSVAETLFDARAKYQEMGVAPAGAKRTIERFARRAERLSARMAELAARHASTPSAATAIVLGCEYALRLPEESDDALLAARALFGELRLVSGCCGLPLDAAGDRAGAERARRELARATRGARRLIVVDAGCALTLQNMDAIPFARAAHEAFLAGREPRVAPEPVMDFRYHDPCLLGRGLGLYDAPRALVALWARRPAAEFERRREHGRCSGGGGLLPATRPENAAIIAADRVREHELAGGGRIVTACAMSLRQFRAAGARAIDLASIVRRLSAA